MWITDKTRNIFAAKNSAQKRLEKWLFGVEKWLFRGSKVAFLGVSDGLFAPVNTSFPILNVARATFRETQRRNRPPRDTIADTTI